MKKIISLTVLSLLSLLCCISAYAALPEDTIIPLWENVVAVDNDFYFSGSNSYVDVSVTANSGTTSMVVAAKVYKQTASGSWSLVKSKTGTSSTFSVSFEVPFEAVKGTYYKSVLSITSYRGGVRYSDSHTAYATY